MANLTTKIKSRFDHWYLLRNTDSKKSVSFTMVVYGFIAVTLWLILSITEELWGIKIREFSGTESMAYLAPIFSIYFFRKQQVGNTVLTEGTTTVTSTNVSVEETNVDRGTSADIT